MNYSQSIAAKESACFGDQKAYRTIHENGLFGSTRGAFWQIQLSNSEMNLLDGFKKRVTPLCTCWVVHKFSTGPILRQQVGKACGHSTQWQLCDCVHLLRLAVFKYLKHKATSFRSLSHARMLNCSARRLFPTHGL